MASAGSTSPGRAAGTLNSALSSALISELTALAADARRARGGDAVREGAERALVVLRTALASSAPPAPLPPPADPLAPLLLPLTPQLLAAPIAALRMKPANPALLKAAVAPVQRLVGFRCIDPRILADVLDAVGECVGLGAPMEVQLRALQVAGGVLACLPEPEGAFARAKEAEKAPADAKEEQKPVEIDEDTIVKEVFKIAIYLHLPPPGTTLASSHGGPVVAHTAHATVRQILSAAMERASKCLAAVPAEERESLNGYPAFPPPLATAFALFHDLCLLTGDPANPHLLVLPNLPIPKALGLELLASTLPTHSLSSPGPETPFSLPPFVTLLKTHLLPLLIRTFSDGSPDFPLLARLLRCVLAAVSAFASSSECAVEIEILLSVVDRLAADAAGHSAGGTSATSLASASTSSLPQPGPAHPAWAHACALEMFAGLLGGPALVDVWGLDSGAEVVGGVLATAGKIAGAAAEEGWRGEGGVKVSCLEQLEKLDPPHVPERYTAYLSARMLAATAASFASIATHTPSDHLDPAAFLSAGSALLLPQLAPLLAALETPLQQSLLDAATSFAVACARTALPGERDAWLSALARAAVPEDKPAASAPPPPVEKGGTLMSTLTSLASFASAPARPLPVGPDRGAACLAALVSAAGSLSEETDMEPAAWEPLLSAIWKAETRGRSPGWPDVAKWPTGGARHLLRGIAGWTDAQASKSAWDAAAWGVARAKDCILARADVLPSDAEGWESAMAPIVKTAWAEGAGQARQVACAAFGECFAAAVEKGDMADPAAEGRVLKSLKDFVGVGANGRSAAWAVDVTKAGMDALDKVLQRSGERFSRGWEAVLEVVGGVVGSSGAARKAPGKVEVDARYLAVAGTEEAAGSALMTGAGGPAASRAQAMVRAAFPVVRLICNDFLPLLDPGCLGACVDALACFGAQGDDLNVTLSAVGLAWTVSDHIMTLRTATAAEGATADAEKLDTLWNNLLEQLADLCTDPRPEVRHAANQTLFRTVTLQGGKLTEEVWDNVLWNVLFPLLERVRIVGDKVAQAADRAAVDKVGQEGAPRLASSGFVLHHSRNTVAKQWDETRALTLTGVGKCFREHMAAFVSIGAGRFDKAWALFFEYVKDWCLGYSQEVSLASMKTLATVLGYPQDTDVPEDVREKLEPYWMTAWGEWTTIGEGIVIRANGDLPDRRSTDHDGRSGSEEVSKPAEDDDGPDGAARESFDHVFEKAEDGLPREISGEFTQETIAAYASAFLDLYPTVQPQFKDGDFTRLMRLLNQLLVYVTAVEPGSKYAKAVWDLDVLSPLQDVVLKILSALETTRPTLYLAILGELASHVKLPIRRGFASPTRAHASAKAQSKGAPQGPTFVTFSAQAMEMAWDIVDRHRTLPALYADDVLPDLLLAHGDLMKYKYDCPSAGSKPTDVPLWKAAASAFLRLLRCLLPSMRSLEGQISPATVSVVYEAALDTFDAFLLSPSNPGPDATETQLAADEDFDISVLREIENDLVPYLGMPGMPESLALQLVDTLRKGSNLYLGVDSAHGAAVPSSPARAVNGVHAKAAQGGSKAGPNVNKVRVVNIPVHRERFANECLDLMFGLCSDNREDNVEERRRVAEIVAPALLERCSTVISNYVVAKGQGKQQHHRAPTGLGQTIAPQDDYQELVRVLGKLVELKLRPKVLKIPESSNPVKNLILSGPSAHLFFLYLPICECLSSADGHASEDRDVEELVKRALKRMGMEMGLV